MTIGEVTSLHNNLLARTPWPGPRPFDPKGKHRLYGRDREVRELRHRLGQHRVVLFHAHSGVGKSSLLNAGLYPALKRNKQIVLLCTWGDLAEGGGSDPGAEFFAGALLSGLTEAGALPDLCKTYQREREHRTFIEEALEALQSDKFKSPVLVFDQVEEVMRRDRPLAAAFFAEVGDVAYNFPSIAQIVSFRSEYKAYETLDRSLVSSRIATEYELLPLDEDEVVEAICLPARDWSAETGIPLEVDEKAARELVMWWTQARELQTGIGSIAWRQDLPEQERAQLARDIKELGESEVGLLHVQAVLDALFECWLSKETGRPALIDQPFVTTFRDQLVPDAVTDRASARVMVEALRQYIRRTFQRACQAPLAGVPAPIAGVVRALVEPAAARMAPMLSSSGFKTAKEVGELGSEAVSRLLYPLPVDVTWVGEAVKTLARELTEDNDEAPQDLSVVGIGVQPDGDSAEVDPHSLLGPTSVEDAPLVAGPARQLGLSPSQVESAGALAAAVAIAAMANEQVLRKSPTSRQAIFELVHDGFGPALRSWGAGVMERPRKWIDSPVTVLGEDIVWTEADARSADAGEADVAQAIHAAAEKIDGSRIEGARWVGCWIGTLPDEGRLRMRGLQFIDAELRGSVIEHAHLKDVEFVDCRMNGVLFRDCVMENVLFKWTDRNISSEQRNCDMLSFRQIVTRVGGGDQSISATEDRSLGPRFDNITIRNLSVHNASGLWKATRANLEQVALDADDETEGTARIEVELSSLRQWRVGHNWRGTLRLDKSDIDFSVVYGVGARIERSADDHQVRIGPHNDFNAVNELIVDARAVEVLTERSDGQRAGESR